MSPTKGLMTAWKICHDERELAWIQTGLGDHETLKMGGKTFNAYMEYWNADNTRRSHPAQRCITFENESGRFFWQPVDVGLVNALIGKVRILTRVGYGANIAGRVNAKSQS